MNIPAITIHTDDVQFLHCLPPVLVLEGGNDDDKHDPGGRTSRGVIQREYNVYRRSKGLSIRDVWQADWVEIFDIYFTSYWMPWCPQLWVGVNQMYFDQAVNQGPVAAARNLQRALNSFHDPGWTAAALRATGLRAPTLVVDGHIGPQTLLALNGINDRLDFLKSYYDWDMSYYRQLANWWHYGKGWGNRAISIYNTAVSQLKAEMQHG